MVYFNGTVLFVAGLAIVQAHNVWALRRPVVVTILGWATMALGLSRMVFPKQHPAVSLDGGVKAYATQGVLCLVGVALCVMGYGATS